MTSTAIIKKFVFPAAAIVALATLMFASGQAQAIFELTRTSLRATGTIVDIDSDSFIVDTGGTEPPFEVLVNRHTNFRRPLNNLDDLDIGDDIEVRARNRNGVFEAQRVEIVEVADYGYGTGTNCERLRISRAQVISVNASQVVVRRNGIDATVQIDSNTRIRGYQNNRTVTVGDTVDVNGDDCGANGFYANRILIRRPESDHEDD